MKRFGLRGQDSPLKRASIPHFTASAHPPVLAEEWSYIQLFAERVDQGDVGSCVSTTTLEIFRAVYAKHFKTTLPPLSPRALYTLTQIAREPQSVGQDVGLFEVDALWTLMNEGYATAADWPNLLTVTADYFAVPPQSILKKIGDIIAYRYIPGPTDGSVSEYVTLNKLALQTSGPLAIGGPFYEEWMEPGPSGNLDPNPQNVAGQHERVRAGWDNHHLNLDGTRGAWRDVNSWGPDWAMNGAMWTPFSLPAAANPTDTYVMTVPEPVAMQAAA